MRSFGVTAVIAAYTELLLFVTTSRALQLSLTHFPREKTVTYKYSADVKVGTSDPESFDSQFAISGLLHIKYDGTDSTLNNAYYVALKNVKHTLYNGESINVGHYNVSHPIPDAARIIEDPFLVVFDNNGKIDGVKLSENESGWSRNIKRAIASILQLDHQSVITDYTTKPYSFVTTEDTIYGKCSVSYDVKPQQSSEVKSKVFTVTKNHELENCTGFVQRDFNHVNDASCLDDSKDQMKTTVHRTYQVENDGNEILIKKLDGYAEIKYCPWQHYSETDYILTNQTLVLDSVMPVADASLPTVNFQAIQLVKDISFKKPLKNLSLHTAYDVTQGRHIPKPETLVIKVNKMLREAGRYLEENHFEMMVPEFKHGQIVNRLLHTMVYMDLGSLEQVFNGIQDGTTPREVTIRNIFLNLIPLVGTTATCLFTRDIIRKQKISDFIATQMLGTLPFHVRMPTEDLLLEMEELTKFGDAVSLEVRKTSILCFGTLINEVFKNQYSQVTNPLLNRYVQHFFDHVKSEPTYEMKTVYLWAMKNVAIGNVNVLLAPIIRGDVTISGKPNYIRFLAMIAASESIARGNQLMQDIYWSILTDVNISTEMRMLAYDILINQSPDMEFVMNIYKFMRTEKDKNLYNYHYSTLKNLASSEDSSTRSIQEIAQKALGFTTPANDSDLFLSENYVFSYKNRRHLFDETWRMKLFVDEETETPRIGFLKHSSNIMRKPASDISFYWRVDGMDELLSSVFQLGTPISNEVVKNLLISAAKDMPRKKNIQIEFSFLRYGRAIFTRYYNKDTVGQIIPDIDILRASESEFSSILQVIDYNPPTEMEVSTDLGVPAVVAIQLPLVVSLKMNAELTKEGPLFNVKIGADLRIWKHETYSTSIYNPIADVLHSVQRVDSYDIVVPVTLNIAHNTSAVNEYVTILHPNLPTKGYSEFGVLHYSKDYVTILKDETNLLKEHCSTCRHHEVVTKENTPEDGVTRIHQSMKSSIFTNTSSIHLSMITRRHVTNVTASPQSNHSGSLTKAVPDIIEPDVSIDAHVVLEDSDYTRKPLHDYGALKLKAFGTVKVYVPKTEIEPRTWSAQATIDLSEGHTDNKIIIESTKQVPGEEGQKYCLRAQMMYPTIEIDPLKISSTAKEGLNVSISFSKGTVNQNVCGFEDPLIFATVKGELSNEQKELYKNAGTDEKCARDIQNPLYKNKYNLIPRTYNCIENAIARSTLRKYSVNVVALDEKIMKATLEFPIDRSIINVTNEYGEEDIEIPDLNELLVGAGIGRPLWDSMLINTHFSWSFSARFMNDLSEVCSVYPKVINTADNGTISYSLTDEWTLLSGDYKSQLYAIFVKKIHDDSVAMKMYIANHVIEVVPTDSDLVVIVDGNTIEQYKDGFIVPSVPDEINEYSFRVAWNNGLLFIFSKRVPVWVEYTTSSVTLILDNELEGKITGICGHLDGTHNEKLPKVYTVTAL